MNTPDHSLRELILSRGFSPSRMTLTVYCYPLSFNRLNRSARLIAVPLSEVVERQDFVEEVSKKIRRALRWRLRMRHAREYDLWATAYDDSSAWGISGQCHPVFGAKNDSIVNTVEELYDALLESAKSALEEHRAANALSWLDEMPAKEVRDAFGQPEEAYDWWMAFREPKTD